MNDDAMDVLNAEVSRAISAAERLDDAGDPGVIGAYADVSRYEEALAALHPANDLEGAVARVGAITAALRANDLARATELARRYEPDLSVARRQEIRDAFRRLAPRAPRSRNPLAEFRAGIRARFQELAA